MPRSLSFTGALVYFCLAHKMQIIFICLVTFSALDVQYDDATRSEKKLNSKVFLLLLSHLPMAMGVA